MAAPPRPVPRLLPLYLVLLATQLGWLFLGVGLFAFWFNCAFGADVKAGLFLAPTRTVAATVTGFERTPLIEGTGSPHVAGDMPSSGTQPIFAVHYTYPLPGGGTGHGTSYQGDTAEFGLTIETAGSDLWTGTQPPPPDQYTGEREDVAVGLLVPVQYVRAFPTASRVLGMRSNVYPVYALGVLVFALIGVGRLWSTPRNLRRVRFLLGAGVENTERQTLEDPAGHLLSLLLTDPGPRLLGIRDGQLHAPRPLAWVVVLLLPVGGFLISAAYLWQHWAAIHYTWHSLTG